MMPQIYPVACHTNHIGHNSTFVAIKGLKEDGMQYIAQALDKGATTIVVQHDAIVSDEIKQAIAHAHAELVVVDNTRLALAQLSAQAMDYPARKLRIVGVTGTKGKTTSVFVLEHVLRMAGYKTALLSTVKNKILDQNFPTNLTTQHPDYLHMFFAQCIAVGVDIVVMEVAAQAHSLHRVEGLEFDGFIFTNFDKEHAEFYSTMEEYFDAKASLLKQVKSGAPLLLNSDNQSVASLIAAYPQAKTFGCQSLSYTYKAVLHGNGVDSLRFEVQSPFGSGQFMCSALVGSYNAYNLLGVISLCLELGLSSEAIAQGIRTFTAVPGRLERYQLPNGATCFIDYAHNPSSYHAVLSMVRSLTPHLIVVFGCGGDRDKTKRPMMGAIAAHYADLVILTSDNPRSEDPHAIVQDILIGIEGQSKVLCELDREQAIKKAYAAATPTSVIMLLGKGPDEYQIIGNQKLYFSEAQVVRSL